jgi:hypothetical protein
MFQVKLPSVQIKAFESTLPAYLCDCLTSHQLAVRVGLSDYDRITDNNPLGSVNVHTNIVIGKKAVCDNDVVAFVDEDSRGVVAVRLQSINGSDRIGHVTGRVHAHSSLVKSKEESNKTGHGISVQFGLIVVGS